MNKGYLPDELVQVVQQPENLTQHPWLGGFYGRVKHSVRQIYRGQTRWFEGDPTFLDPLSKKAVSERYVALMGRRDAIFAEATTATDTSDNQWSAELLLHIIRLNLKDMEAQLLNARSLGEIGFSLTNNNWRNWYMNSALKLEGTLGHDKAIDLQAPDLVKVSSLSAILESLRFRADGERIARDGVEPTMGVTFTEVDLDFALALRNGVMEFSERRPQDPDVQIDLTSAAFGGILSAKPEGDGHRQ
jgi:alkyl sulfatase BDS1-like metallo-beta-lactamase superfamily hydrolase